MKVALIVNTGSRRGRAAYPEALRALKEAGAELVFTRKVRRGRRIPDAISAAAAAGPDRILLGGGDGTIASSSRQFAEGGLTMAVLPLGTANSFARTAGIPLEVDEAAALALSGKETCVDLGRLGERWFTGTAAVGLPALTGRTIPGGLKRVFGRFAYVIWGTWKLARFKGFRCTVRKDGEETNHHVVEVRILNGRHLGGVEVSERAGLQEREIVLQLVSGTSSKDLMLAWAHQVTGDSPEVGEITELSGTRFYIHTVPSQPVSIDGEILASTPAEASVAPAALKLVVPR